MGQCGVCQCVACVSMWRVSVCGVCQYVVCQCVARISVWQCVAGVSVWRAALVSDSVLTQCVTLTDISMTRVSVCGGCVAGN